MVVTLITNPFIRPAMSFLGGNVAWPRYLEVHPRTRIRGY